MYPVTHPYSPGDVLATVYDFLGIDTKQVFHDRLRAPSADTARRTADRGTLELSLQALIIHGREVIVDRPEQSWHGAREAAPMGPTSPAARLIIKV